MSYRAILISTILLLHIGSIGSGNRYTESAEHKQEPAVMDAPSRVAEITYEPTTTPEPTIVPEVIEPAYSNEDIYWLSWVVHSEAGGECQDGKIAVANVVLNRVASPHFPNTVKEVIFQKNKKVYQFSVVQNGAIYKEPSRDSVSAARMALEGQIAVGEDALYFYNPKLVKGKSWIKSRPVVARIGNHTFAK